MGGEVGVQPEAESVPALFLFSGSPAPALPMSSAPDQLTHRSLHVKRHR